MESFDTLLEQSATAHGHLCPGQVVGVRMAMLGCRLLRLDNPKSREQIKKFLVYVEMDRCTADAVAHVTGVKLGRRSLKFMDYGIMAATFFHLETGSAYRILSTEESRDLSGIYAPEENIKAQQQLAAYKRMPDNVLFKVQEVRVSINELDLPGPSRKKTVCSRCGQVVRDGKEVFINGKPVCRPCSDVCYFSHPREILWPGMDWSPAGGRNGRSQEGMKPGVPLCNAKHA
ncbi:MAG: FmdE family protein [Pseudomonadota bacterium]